MSLTRSAEVINISSSSERHAETGGLLAAQALGRSTPNAYQDNADADDQTGLPWYAVKVRTRSELAVVDQFALRGLTAFSPCTKLWKRYADRRKQIEQPLFPGYVFCRLDVAQRLPVLMTPGVAHIVGIGQTPEPVPTHEIFSLQQLSAAASVQPHPYLHVGQRVRVEVGPFAGVEGQLVQFKGTDRLVVSVNLLQRSISAEVDPRLVVPLGPPARPAVSLPPFARAAAAASGN